MNVENPTFDFCNKSQLITHLQKASENLQTGYWEFSFSSPTAEGSYLRQYLGISQGRIVYAGSQPTLSWSSFLQILQRSLPQLRTSDARERILKVENSIPPEQHPFLGRMLNKLVKEHLLEYQDAQHVLQLNVLVALEDILSAGPGMAKFIPNYELVASAPIQGFEVESLLTKILRRSTQWSQIESLVPTIEAIPVLNPLTANKTTLPAHQIKQLEKFVGKGKTLRQLASQLGKDPLEIAITFAGLIQKQLVTLQLPATNPVENIPKVFIVDDSKLLIEQFQKLMIGWGYKVGYSSNALHAVEAIEKESPDVIFLDINMPGASGFDLIKSIRRIPQIASVPLVLLTGETSVSNQWRAQWASCKFLAKPKTSAEVPTFRDTLQALLNEVVPHADEQLPQSHSLLIQAA